MLIKYAFNELNMHRVELTVNGGNERVIKCYEKAGLRECGRLHERIYAGGERSDLVYMELLRSEWEN